MLIFSYANIYHLLCLNARFSTSYVNRPFLGISTIALTLPNLTWVTNQAFGYYLTVGWMYSGDLL
jgi:hypothetical protein